jgi:hypothetical protein
LTWVNIKIKIVIIIVLKPYSWVNPRLDSSYRLSWPLTRVNVKINMIIIIILKLN